MRELLIFEESGAEWPGFCRAWASPCCFPPAIHRLNQIKFPPETRYKPTNIYRKSMALDPEVKRVAILPMTTLQPTEAFQAGVDSLQPLLHAELEKAKRFEMIVVTPEQLQNWTGQRVWRADEQLPPDFFDRSARKQAARLFCLIN
jgi:hypothetical protein